MDKLRGLAPPFVLMIFVVGSIVEPIAFGEALFFGTPLIFTGLAFALPAQTKFYNIGAEGQILAGGLAAASLGITLGALPAPVSILISCLGAFAAGVLLAGTAWILKYWCDINEVISTILLNLGMQPVAAFFVNKVFPAAGMYQAQTAPIGTNAEMPLLADWSWTSWGWIRAGGINLTTVIALAILLLYSAFSRTRFALVARATGFTPKAVIWLGHKPELIQLFTAVVGGGLAGLGAVSAVLGKDHALVKDFSVGLGYSGIVAALMFGDSASGVFAASLILGLLNHMVVALQLSRGLPRELIQILQGCVLLAVLTWKRWRYLFHER